MNVKYQRSINHCTCLATEGTESELFQVNDVKHIALLHEGFHRVDITAQHWNFQATITVPCCQIYVLVHCQDGHTALGIQSFMETLFSSSFFFSVIFIEFTLCGFWWEISGKLTFVPRYHLACPPSHLTLSRHGS